MEIYVAIILVAFIGSTLTFFTGFGLGTILLPVMALFFPIEIALLNTAIVHLFNNIWKFRLLYLNINWKIAIRFGGIALLFAFLGSYLLQTSAAAKPLYYSSLWGESEGVTLMQFSIGILMMAFAALELSSAAKKLQFDSKFMPLGAAITGFFGGLSGHQGALRSMFLIRLGLSKEAFVATGTAIACFVDFSRLYNYIQVWNNSNVELPSTLLLAACAAALLGAQVGNFYFKKIRIDLLEKLVAIGILVIAVSLLS